MTAVKQAAFSKAMVRWYQTTCCPDEFWTTVWCMWWCQMSEWRWRLASQTSSGPRYDACDGARWVEMATGLTDEFWTTVWCMWWCQMSEWRWRLASGADLHASQRYDGSFHTVCYTQIIHNKWKTKEYRLIINHTRTNYINWKLWGLICETEIICLIFRVLPAIFCCMMLRKRGLCHHVVCVSVKFVHSVETNKDIFKIFHYRVAKPF